MKRIKTTASNALKNGLVKVGDDVWVKCKISEVDNTPTDYPIYVCGYGWGYGWISNESEILIPKPEPKPMKQTAVEWLKIALEHDSGMKLEKWIADLFKEALELEKQQI
jgi:hypothetical protein